MSIWQQLQVQNGHIDAKITVEWHSKHWRRPVCRGMYGNKRPHK